MDFQMTAGADTESETDKPVQGTIRDPWLWSGSLVLLGLFLLMFIITQQSTDAGVIVKNESTTGFSAARAMKHLDVIAASPRPVGSEGHETTKAYLMKTLTDMGLQPQIQKTDTALRFPDAPGFAAGSVENVIALIPGTSSTGAVVLNAHYDGAATGPGAADCGSCVIVILETLRVIKGGAPLKNDLIVVFSDAEEVGDLGANAFATQHPWMEDVRLAINYEAMGTGGPAYLYAMNRGNADLVASFTEVAPWKNGNSFIAGIFGLIPEQRLACDLQDYLNRGSAGYGFVFTGNTSAYHTMLDNKQLLDPATVQQLGDNTLALLHHFAERDLQHIKTNSEAVFFNIWPGQTVHYSADMTFPLAVGSLILLLVAFGVGIRKGDLRSSRVILAAVIFFSTVFFTFITSAVVWHLLNITNENLQTSLIGNWAVEWFLAGMLVLAVSVMTTISLLLRRILSYKHQYAGALTGFSVLSLLFSSVFPAGSYLFTWPVLMGSLVILLPILKRGFSGSVVVNSAIVLAAAAVPVMLIVPVMIGPNPFTGLLIRLDSLTGLPLLAVDTVFAALLSGLVVPVTGTLFCRRDSVENRWKWMLPVSGLVLTVTLFTIGLSLSGYDSRHPRPESVRYELDADKNTAQWVTGDERPGEWVSRFISTHDRTLETAGSSLLEYWPTTFTGPAGQMELHHPGAELLEDRQTADRRMIRLQFTPQKQGSFLNVTIQAGTQINAAQLNGRPLDLEEYAQAETGTLKINYANCPKEGITLSLKVDDFTKIQVSLVEIRKGLPTLPGKKANVRPETTMPSPISADYTVVRKQTIL